MDTTAQIAAVQQLADDVNSGNLDTLRQRIAAEYYGHAPEGDEPDAADVFSLIATGVKAAFPDLHVDVTDLTANGDQLKGRMTLTGTLTNPIWNVPPTGDPFNWSAPVSIRFVGDKLAINVDETTPREIVALLRALRLVNPPDEMDKASKFPATTPEVVLRMLYTGQVADKPCSHLHDIRVTEPTVKVCEDCVALGDSWPALRMCLTCGYVGCCDMAKNHHMKQHYEKTGHGLFRSIRKDDGWIWCYPDNAFFGRRTLEKYRKS